MKKSINITMPIELNDVEELMYRIRNWNPITGPRWIRNNLRIPMETTVSPIYDVDSFTGERTTTFSKYRRVWKDGQYVIMAIYSYGGKFDGIAVTDTDRNFLLKVEGFCAKNPKPYAEWKLGYKFPWDRNHYEWTIREKKQ